MSTVRAKFRPAKAVLASVTSEAGVPPAPKRRARSERLARQLALAYRIEQAIDAGEVASYGDMARRLGLTQPRITQIVALTLLSPAIQERVLLGGEIGIREVIRVAAEAEWGEQEH